MKPVQVEVGGGKKAEVKVKGLIFLAT